MDRGPLGAIGLPCSPLRDLSPRDPANPASRPVSCDSQASLITHQGLLIKVARHCCQAALTSRRAPLSEIVYHSGTRTSAQGTQCRSYYTTKLEDAIIDAPMQRSKMAQLPGSVELALHAPGRSAVHLPQESPGPTIVAGTSGSDDWRSIRSRADVWLRLALLSTIKNGHPT